MVWYVRNGSRRMQWQFNLLLHAQDLSMFAKGLYLFGLQSEESAVGLEI